MQKNNRWVLCALLMSCFISLAMADPKNKQNVVFFAPYKDINLHQSGGSMESLTGYPAKVFILSFIGDPGRSCNAVWRGGSMSLGFGKDKVDALRKAGGDIIISFGGQGASYLSQNCGTAEQLAEQYKRVINAYNLCDEGHLCQLDFDIEGSMQGDMDAFDKMATALGYLKKDYPDIKVGFTLQADPNQGARTDELPAVSKALDKGLGLNNLASVNLMAMDFYGSGTGDEFKDITATIEAGFNQLKGISQFKGISDKEIYNKLGMTPMIGVNDDPKEVVTLDIARQLASWAKQKQLGLISFWSFNRDNPCGIGVNASPLCSGVAQQSMDFSKIFSFQDASSGLPKS